MTQSENNSAKITRTSCGGLIENPDDYPSVLYKNERIYFCDQNCVKAFHSDPEGFLAGEVDHTTGAD